MIITPDEQSIFYIGKKTDFLAVKLNADNGDPLAALNLQGLDSTSSVMTVMNEDGSVIYMATKDLSGNRKVRNCSFVN